MALKSVHRRAKNYLITLDIKEYKGLKNKIEKGDVGELDKVILGNTQEFDDLLSELSKMTFIKAKVVEIIKGRIIE
jgi:hypothetical protein